MERKPPKIPHLEVAELTASKHELVPRFKSGHFESSENRSRVLTRFI
jgi:hypothetical protein